MLLNGILILHSTLLHLFKNTMLIQHFELLKDRFSTVGWTQIPQLPSGQNCLLQISFWRSGKNGRTWRDVALDHLWTAQKTRPCKVVPPKRYICWFRFTPWILVRYITNKNHSEIGVINLPTERYPGRGHHLVGVSFRHGGIPITGW